MFDSVSALRASLAALLADLEPPSLSGAQAVAWWEELDRVERLAAAGKTLLARRVAESGQWQAAGARSAADDLARRAGTSVGAARAALEASQRLAGLPATARAAASGELSAPQAALVADAAAADPTAEAHLLEVAAREALPQLRDECARVKAAADADPAATLARVHAARALRRYPDSGGAWHLHAQGTVVAGAQLNAALDPLVDEVFRAARAAGRREPMEAYAFDALLLMAERAAGARPGEAAQPAVAVPAGGSAAATSPSADATGSPAPASAAPGSPAPATRDSSPRAPSGSPPNPRFLALLRVDVEALRRGALAGGETCEIAGVGPVPVATARELLGDAVLKLVVTRGVDVPNVTHLGRGPTAAQRVALAWTSPHCSAQGCTGGWLETDHREDWARTRHTRLDELDSLCSHCHDLKTRLGWALVRGSGRRPFVPPDDARHPRVRGAGNRRARAPAPPGPPGPHGSSP